MAVRRYRAALIGLNHYHATGWFESLADFPDRIEIVALYDPDQAFGKRLAPDHHDPHLSAALPATASAIPFFDDLERLIDEIRPDIAVVTLPNVAAPDAIARLAAASIHVLADKPGAKTAD